MNLLDSLGLGGVFGNSYPLPAYNQQAMLGYAQAQQQYQPVYHCKHGLACPLCLEITKKAEIETKKQQAVITQKKLAYENRCKKYMVSFRKEYQCIKEQ